MNRMRILGLLLFFMVALNGFFAASEVALLSSRLSRLRSQAEEGHVGAQAAVSLLSNASGALKRELSHIPLFVKAGSIIPLGSRQQFTGEKPEAQIELRIYPGADGTFTLYEDEGDSYRYEQGAYATIPLTWDDKKNTLVIVMSFCP